MLKVGAARDSLHGIVLVFTLNTGVDSFSNEVD